MSRPAPRALVAAALECDPESLTATSALARHPKWDSFAHLRIMIQLEESYGVEINDTNIRKYETFAAIEALYAELAAQEATG
jgi:acyl carrier protein